MQQYPNLLFSAVSIIHSLTICLSFYKGSIEFNICAIIYHLFKWVFSPVGKLEEAMHLKRDYLKSGYLGFIEIKKLQG